MIAESPITIRTEQITAMPLFDGMSDAGKNAMAQTFLDNSEIVDLDDGEVLMREGTLAFGTGYILVQGRVAVERGGKMISEVTAPSLLGEMSQFKASDMRMATIYAKGPCVVLQFQWDELHEQAKSELANGHYPKFLDALERLVWERSDYRPLAEIPLFRNLAPETKTKVCLIFPWITKRETYKTGQVVFKEGAACQLTGYLLTQGAVRVSKNSGGEKAYSAPNIIGVMPKDEPRLLWTGTAIALGDVELFSFSWKTYIGKLRERLTAEEQTKLVDSMKQNAAEHFWH